MRPVFNVGELCSDAGEGGKAVRAEGQLAKGVEPDESTPATGIQKALDQTQVCAGRSAALETLHPLHMGALPGQLDAEAEGARAKKALLEYPGPLVEGLVVAPVHTGLSMRESI